MFPIKGFVNILIINFNLGRNIRLNLIVQYSQLKDLYSKARSLNKSAIEIIYSKKF